MQVSPVAMALYDSDGNIQKLNERFTELFGYTIDDVHRVEEWFSLVYPDEDYRQLIHKRWFSAVEDYLSTGKNFVPIEAQVVCKDDTLRDIKFNFSAINDIYLTTFEDVSGYKEILEQLSRSEERYRALFEGSRDGIVMIDTSSNIIDANKSYCEMLGYSLAEIKKLNLMDITPEKWQEWEQREIIGKQLVERGYSDTYEKEYIHKNGTVFSVELDTYRFEDTGRREFFFWGVVRDISERKKAKEALRESEERFRKLSSLTFEGILLHKEASYLDSNITFQKMFGYTPEELYGANILELIIAPDDVGVVMSQMKEDHAKPYEVEVLHKSGKVFPVEIEARNITWEGENIRVAAFHDIEERKQTKKIAKSRLAILEHSYNSTLHELLVKTLDEAEQLTNSFIGFFHFLETDQKTINLQVWSTNTTKNKCRATVQMHYNLDEAGVWTDCVHAGGPVIHNDFYSLANKKGFPAGHAMVDRELLVPVFRKNKIVAIIGVGNKVTEYDENDITIISQLADLAWDIAVRKKTEDTLKQTVIEMEKIQQHLTQAQKMEAIGTLAGGIAHDFNNILGGIIGSVDILGNVLQKEELSSRDKVDKYLSILRNASSRGANIVKQLLTLSRKQDNLFRIVRLNESLRNVSDIIQYSFPKSIEVKFIIPDTDMIIEADGTQIEQALLNLCVNASHAMTVMRSDGEREGGVLSVEIKKIMSDNIKAFRHPDIPDKLALIQITVSDTGVGMGPEMKTQIFDPFYTTKDKNEGTGLGLAMVYSIIKQHGGYINVYSEKGSGTLFSIYIPEYINEPKDADSDLNNEEILSGTGNILIIDDEEDILSVVEEMLTQRGFSVIPAIGAMKGVDIYKSRWKFFDAVILDLSMPEKSGLEVFLELKAVNPEVKVLMSSGFARDERIQKAIDSGACGFIKKPYSIGEVVIRLNEIIKSK